MLGENALPINATDSEKKIEKIPGLLENVPL